MHIKSKVVSLVLSATMMKSHFVSKLAATIIVPMLTFSD